MVRNDSVKVADWLICNSTYDIELGAFMIAPEIILIVPHLTSIWD